METGQSHWDAQSLPYDDVKRIWQLFSHPNLDHSDSAYPAFYLEPIYLELNPDYLDTLETETLPRLANKLLEYAGNPNSHVNWLNHEMAGNILCTFDQCLPKTVDGAYNLLTRLPRFPPELPFDEIKDLKGKEIDQAIPEGYTVTAPPGEERSLWVRLKIVSLMDGCTMRMALAIAECPSFSLCYAINRYLNIVARLMDMVYEGRMTYASNSSHPRAITIAYLWTMWQRSVMLFLSAVLTIDTNSTNVGEMLALSFPKLLGRPSIRDAWHGLPTQKSGYMCAWAFELLQASRGSLAFDFRNFHKRFTEAFPNAQPRCTTGYEVCTGSSPESCGRFNCKELVRGDQSLHDEICRGCKRLTWDKSSYLKVTGGRAVDISRQSSKIKYCRADERTLAISHVWSHGQGGRPDTGINGCLHDRYVRLARKYGCASYWIDTVCIPDDHDLRREAIAHINDTFSESKITLICDRDLSSLDAPAGEDDVAQAERLLVTLLVCDWNVRAWTLLEAVRGSHSIHISCAKNELVSIGQLIGNILQKGSIDIAVLALTAQHLRGKSNIRFKVMTASAMLSHRHATRPGDDVVIWNLMCATRAEHISSDPSLFWKSKVGFFLNTGYLMSSAPRLKGVKGFSWAPCTPNVRSTNPLLPNAYPSDGSGSETGRITAKGLEAVWLIHHVEARDDKKYSGRTHDHLDEISIQGQSDAGLNKCWQEVQKLRNSYPRVCLLVAKSQSIGRYFAAEDSQKDFSLVAVAFSDSKTPKIGNTYEDEWTWEGAYEWPSRIPLPKMEWENILLM